MPFIFRNPLADGDEATTQVIKPTTPIEQPATTGTIRALFPEFTASIPTPTPIPTRTISPEQPANVDPVGIFNKLSATIFGDSGTGGGGSDPIPQGEPGALTWGAAIPAGSTTAPIPAPKVGDIGTTPTLHGPGETWTMGPGQGCSPGYVQAQAADGKSWTCIPQSDFNKIFHGDFSPLFPGSADAKAGAATVDPKSTSGGGTAPLLDAAGKLITDPVAFFADRPDAVSTMEVPPNPSGTGGASTQGPSGGSDSGSNNGSPIDRLLDLISAQYASAGTPSQSGGVLGAVGMPLDGTVQGDAATSSSSVKGIIILVIGVVIVGGAYYLYKKHHKAKAA